MIWNEDGVFMIWNEDGVFVIWNEDGGGVFIIWNDGSGMWIGSSINSLRGNPQNR